MTETRYMLGADEALILRTWLEAVAEPQGVRSGNVTAFRPHNDDAWTPEHLTMRAALFLVGHDEQGNEDSWSFMEVTHPIECEEIVVEEQIGARFHSRSAAEGLLSSYAPLFSWTTSDERFTRGGAELVLQRASVGERAQHFLLVRAAEERAHEALLAQAPVVLAPLRESHAWHLWKLASGDRRMKPR